MSFDLAHQNKVVGDTKTSIRTPKTSSHDVNKINEDSHPNYSILHLQRTIGNQAVQRLILSSGTAVFDFAKIGIHPKLKVSQPSDPSEQEADRIAEQIMRMSEPEPTNPIVSKEIGWIHRKCTAYDMEKEGEEMKQLKISRKPSSKSSPQTSDYIATEINNIRYSGGASLDTNTREFMEARFGHDFSSVRLHTDERAARSADSVNALAYAVGNHVVFGQGQYQPNTIEGRKILAHELTHTIQHETYDAGPTPLIQRQNASADERANDPNFLLCLALCELGIPPALWRTVVNDMLSAVSREYRDRLGDIRGSQEFERWRAEFTIWSNFNKLKAIIVFVGESRVGPLTIERPAAQAIRRAVLARLAERGLESATIEVASQILRKVALAIEVAVAAGCTGYCASMARINALLDFSTSVLNAVTTFVNVLSQLGAGLRQAIARPILVAQASMDPTNWNLSALPARSRAHMGMIGLAFRLAFTPDSFLASMARPLSSYNISQLLVELAQDINTALHARGGFAQLAVFTPDFIGGLTPLQFVDILKDYRLLLFVHDPELLADQQQTQQATAAP